MNNHIKKINLKKKNFNFLEDKLLLIFSDTNRYSSDIIKTQKKNNTAILNLSKIQNIIDKSQDVIKGISLRNEELGSSYYVNQGYTQASADRIAASESLTKESQSENIRRVKNKAGNAMLSDREAMEVHYDGLFKRYFNLQQEAKNRNIKINFTDNKRIAKLMNLPGINVTTKTKEGVGDRRTGNIEYTYSWEGDYATLHKNGLSSRDADGWGTFDNDYVLSKEDKEWMETHDAALDDNLGARRAMFKLHELDIDPAKLEKPDFFSSMFNTGAKAFGTHFFGNTEMEADENLAKITGKTNTNRFLLDEIQEFQSDYNIQNKDKIEKGEVKSLQFTNDQKDQLARSMSENVSEGVGHFAPMLTELAVVGAITKGTGIPAALGRMIRSGSRVKKMLGHLGMVAVEEAKMQSEANKNVADANKSNREGQVV